MYEIEHLRCRIYDKVFNKLKHEIMDTGDGTLIDARPYTSTAKETIQHDPDAIFMLDWYCDGVIELTCGLDVVDRYDVDALLYSECDQMAETVFLALEY